MSAERPVARSSPTGDEAEPEVTVVVATRDRAARLERLLASLRDQTLAPERFEVVVVDDGSRDETGTVLARAERTGGSRVVGLRGSGSGPAVARNLGWRRARTRLVAFTDDDCEADRAWLDELLAAASQFQGDVLQGPTRPIPRELERAGPFTRTRRIEAPGPWYETCNIAYPRELLERLGGFDEGFPEALGEDTDLGWRSHALGAQLRFVPGACVYHAVDEVGPSGKLREAALGSDSVLVFKRFPELRRETTTLGVFRNPSLARAALAVVGIALRRRTPAAAVLAGPYALDLARRVRAAKAPPWHVAFLILSDAVSAASSARGSLRHRVLIL